MKLVAIMSLFIFTSFLIGGCKKERGHSTATKDSSTNAIKYAKGLEIHPYKEFSIVKITHPWPGEKTDLVYVLKKKNGIIPDSLKQFPIISVPLRSVVVTSTTHIPALELLGVENTLVGFPDTDFISSSKTRKRIDAGKVKRVGNNETLNTEVLIDMKPDAIVSFGINGSNPTLDNLRKSGLSVLINGDWNEQSPLGKAEWIKFFGALYDLDFKANAIFVTIESEYLKSLTLAEKITQKPTVLCGAMYQDQWYVPQGESWMALFLKDAKANYLWANTTGTGSLALPFETVFEKAEKATIWLAPGNFSSLKELQENNPHYFKFDSFKNKKVYSYSLHKGVKGGILYFEWSSTRPDWVLKDLIAIFHPKLLKNHTPYFFEKLN